MIPFNLEEAKTGKPVVTRDGRRMIELQIFNSEVHRPVVGIIDARVLTFTREGKLLEGRDSNTDLFMAPERKSIWVNVYNDGDSLCLSKVKFDTSEECLQNITRKSQYIKTIEITNE